MANKMIKLHKNIRIYNIEMDVLITIKAFKISALRSKK